LTQRQQALGTPVSSSQSDRENDQLMTDALQREVAELRAQLAARTDTTEESAGSDEDRDNELNARLQQSEAADSWKRKYEFLSTDAPVAYQTQEAAEK
jgi:hypothetical protein